MGGGFGGGKGQGLHRERSEIYLHPLASLPSAPPDYSCRLEWHSGVHSLSEHLLCAPTSVTSTQLTGKGLWAQVVLFRQQSWSGLTPQDAGQGHRGAFPPQKEVAALLPSSQLLVSSQSLGENWGPQAA